jgi:hypothetical protein
MSDECANQECPNRPHQGRFVLLRSIAHVVGRDIGGTRRIALWLCAPCAEALKSMTDGQR